VFPGVTGELSEAIAGLSAEDQRLIAGANAAALYGLPPASPAPAR